MSCETRYGLIIQLLGYDKCYAVEDPGYQKISRIYQAQNVCCKFVAMDENGINMEALEESGADVLHISPAHHFPTGLVTPVSRRYELLSWASRKDRCGRKGHLYQHIFQEPFLYDPYQLYGSSGEFDAAI